MSWKAFWLLVIIKYLTLLLYCRLVLQEVTALSLVVEEAVVALAVAVAAVETSRPHAVAPRHSLLAAHR